MTAEWGYGKTEGLDEEAKAERDIIRAQPLSHILGWYSGQKHTPYHHAKVL